MKLMMLGETTGNKRSKEDYEFLGTNAERFVWTELERFGLDRDDFHTFSVYKDMGHRRSELSEEELVDRKIELRRELIMAEPDLTLCVGRHPAEELLQKKLGGNFYETVGKLLYSTEYDIWFVSTIHPTMVARDKDKLHILQSSVENFYEVYREFLEKEYERDGSIQQNIQYL